MRLNPRHWSVATKWSVLVMLIALAPIVGIIKFSYENASQQLMAKTLQALSKGSTDSAGSLEAMISERIRQARYLSNLPNIKSSAMSTGAERDHFNARTSLDLTPVLQAYSHLESIDILDARGATVYSSSRTKPAYDDAAILKAVRENQVYVGGLDAQSGTGRSSLVIAAPIGVGAGQGVLRIQSTPQALMQRVASDHQRDVATLGVLVDAEGQVVARSDEQGHGEKFQLNRAASLVTAPDGKVYYAQFANLTSLPWQYVMAIPTEVVAAERAAQQTQLFMLAIATSMIIGGIARLLVLRFVRPITRLAVATKSLSEGDLTFEVGETPNRDEMGQLQTSFHEAHKQLRRLVARMRLSSHLVAEASEHLYGLTSREDRSTEAITYASKKLAVVAKDLERQVAHFRI